MNFGRHMLFPPSWSGDRYTAAEELAHEMEQEAAEREADQRAAAMEDPRGLNDGLGRAA